MLPIERYDRIERALRTTRVLATEDVAHQLDVSVETVRRDFMTLEQRGLLTRVHGGAIGSGSAYAGQEPAFVDRALLANGAKAAIGRAAAAMISDGQTVVMDVGTTVLAVARALPPDFRGKVATCSLLVAAELAGREHVEVLLSGGRVRGGDLALSNSQTLAFFADLRADIAFLGSGGVDATAGLTDFHLDEVATRRLLIANASASWVLADRSKLGLVAPHRVCDLDAIAGVITDGGAPTDLDRAVRRAGGVLVAAGEGQGGLVSAVLAIDQGTSGTKAIVVDDTVGGAGTSGAAGVVVAAVEVPIRPSYLADGRVEQDPVALLASVLDAGRRALAMAARPVGTLCLANQGETVLAWDPSSGRPLSNAIVWQDARAKGICDELAFHRPWVAQKTGLVLDPYFSAPKMAWLRREHTVEGVVTTTDSWLLHHLTGEFVTDVSTASRSLLMDLDSATWDPELLEMFGIEGEHLPRIVACDEKLGSTSVFGADMTVAGQIVDQQAALLGQGCLAPGEAKCTFGTGAFLLANTGTSAPRSTTGLTTSVGWRIGGSLDYCIDGQVFTVASAVRWLADLGLIGSAADLDRTAAADAAGVTCVPAFAGLAAPWWRSDATASFSGISLSTGAGHLVRAVVEGIAAQVAELTRAVATDLGAPLTTLRVDGGLTRSAALMQAVADLTGLPVEIYPSTHASALGAAALGRLATQPGLSTAEAVSTTRGGRLFEPGWSPARAEDFLDHFRRVAEQNLPPHELPIKEYP